MAPILALLYIFLMVSDLISGESLRDSIIRISPKSSTDVTIVKGLEENGVTFLIEPNIHKESEATVPQTSKQVVFEKLENAGIRYRVVERYLGSAVQREAAANRRAKMSSTLQTFHRFGPNKSTHSFYSTYSEILRWLSKLKYEHQHTGLVSLFNIGKTLEGRAIIGVKISRRSPKTKPSIVIDGGIHAREWLSPATALQIIRKLIDGRWSYSKELLEWYDWYIIPVENPDGYVMTFKKEFRLWRKNKRPNPAGFHCETHGVDLNRNWDTNFNDTSRDPCSSGYGGPFPFSEPETQRSRDFYLKMIKDHRLVATLSMHAYSQLWMYPWSGSSEPADDKEVYVRISKAATKAIKDVSNEKWVYGTPGEIIYAAGGTKMDWLKEAGVRFPFALELRPRSSTNTSGFIQPPDQIKISGDEIFAAVKAMTRELRDIV